MKGKLRINVILNGGEASSILQVLAKYLDQDSIFNFNQDELNATLYYDFAKPPVEIFKEIALNEQCNAIIKIGNEQDFSNEKEEESKIQLETSHESSEKSAKDSASGIVLKTAEKADVCEILKDVIYAKTNAVFKNKISDLFGFSKGIRRQAFEDILDAAINCPIESFEDVEEYWTRKKKRNRKNNVSYAINRIEKFFEERGYKIDIVVFLKTIRELNNKKDVMTMTQRDTAISISERKTPQKGFEQSESKKFILPLEDLKKIYVFRQFFTKQLDTDKSKEEKIHILLDIFKCDEFTKNIRESFEIYIRIALKIKVVNKGTIKQNIKELSESEKPKVSEDTLNHFVVNWFKEKKSFCCGLERFLQLLKRECRHTEL